MLITARKRVSVMNHKEYVRDIDNGKTAVLFIHGILGTPNHFDDMIKILPDTVAVHNLLLPGHGQTPKEFARSSMKKWKNYVFNRLDTLFNRYEEVYIVAHSMGTLFAIEGAIERPDKIKGLFLLAVPLCPMPKPSAAWNSMKVIFDLVSEDDEVGRAAKASFSMVPDKNLLTYVAWLPRYLELMEETSHARKIIDQLTVPGIAIHSKKDELVAMRACDYLKKCKALDVHVLIGSRHFYYEQSDYDYLLNSFSVFMKK